VKVQTVGLSLDLFERQGDQGKHDRPGCKPGWSFIRIKEIQGNQIAGSGEKKPLLWFWVVQSTTRLIWRGSDQGDRKSAQSQEGSARAAKGCIFRRGGKNRNEERKT